MPKPLACLGHLALLLAAARWSDSTSAFVLTGLAPALLLDRCALRLLPWRVPTSFERDLLVRAGWRAGPGRPPGAAAGPSPGPFGGEAYARLAGLRATPP